MCTASWSIDTRRERERPGQRAVAPIASMRTPGTRRSCASATLQPGLGVQQALHGDERRADQQHQQATSE